MGSTLYTPKTYTTSSIRKAAHSMQMHALPQHSRIYSGLETRETLGSVARWGSNLTVPFSLSIVQLYIVTYVFTNKQHAHNLESHWLMVM